MKLIVNHFKKLTKRNRSAIFLGCGESINDLNEHQINFINENFDVWTSNNFLINNSIIPDFYHMEIKHHRNGPLVSRLAKERKTAYKNVNWIIDQTRPYILNYLGLDNYNINNMFVYPKQYRKEETGKYIVDKEIVSVSCNASLTVISDIIVRMGYDCIYFLGVDMNNSKYFWTNNEKYSHVLIEDIMQSCKPDERKPEELHPTFKLQDFLPDFFKHNNQNVVNLSKNSLLCNKMKTKKINEVINEI